ncbi:GmrSD restriction endonuclease domain-containing protein [Streptomyces kanasensis]|uniref:GmrSD restriction endonuclease domain-containing protein n=1 Tax=Streptomyces kanasensis TaxID=936756 RepID=UPI00381F05CC
MRAQEITFLKLVQGEKQFQVPLYQRTYSWTRPQLQRLWDDLVDLVEQQLEGGSPASHFLGSVVLAPGQLQAGGVQRWLVVDGQQRLTTIMLAFTALRDHIRDSAVEGSARTADRIHRQYLVNEFLEGDEHFRLLPTQADRPSYGACVSHSPRSGGADNVGAAYRFFRGVLASGQEQYGEGWTTAVEIALRDLLSIVEITAERGDNVYRIFESINNTGVGLSQSDLLRNYVFMLLPGRGERVYEQLWLPMQQQLGPKNLELLVWLDLVVRGESKAKQTDIYRVQQQRLEPLAGNEEALEKEICELARRAELLRRILDPSLEPDAALRRRLRHLASWGGRIHYPIALHLLDLVDAGNAGADEAAEALGYVEGFLVRRMLCQASTQSLNRLFMSMPGDMERDRPPAEAVQRYLSSRRRGWPTDAEVAEAVRSKPFYWNGQAQQRAYVLQRLEESYGSAEPVDYGRAKLTVEHVLPQRPAQAWLDMLAEDSDDGQTPQELHDLLVHTLGNLTLSAENSKLSNHPFQRKQQILESSSLRMNQEIAATPRWGRKEILERADNLAARAVALWPGPEGEQRADSAEWSGWADLRAALIAMPTGTWTTYGDIAELIGSHPVPVGNFLATKAGVHGAYRVLTAAGRVSASFRWPSDEHGGNPLALLHAEGVPFDASGRARGSHRLTAEDLASLLGKEVPEVGSANGSSEPVAAGRSVQARAARFAELLRENRPDAADAILSFLRSWEELAPGCHLDYGKATETSCFLMLRKDTASRAGAIWPFTLYPVFGTVEVVFQYMRSRPPFDDSGLRREFMSRLNAVPGVELAEAKLELRPSFPLEVLAGHPEDVHAALSWFVRQVTLHEPQDGQGE